MEVMIIPNEQLQARLLRPVEKTRIDQQRVILGGNKSLNNADLDTQEDGCGPHCGFISPFVWSPHLIPVFLQRIIQFSKDVFDSW